MAKIESMSLKELSALRERLWADPIAVSNEMTVDLRFPAAEKFVQGGVILARSLAAGLIKRVEALESRVNALEIKH